MTAKPQWPTTRSEDIAAARLSANPEHAAGFIADMALDLRNIASRARLALLTQLLEMVFTEALEISSSRVKARHRPLSSDRRKE